MREKMGGEGSLYKIGGVGECRDVGELGEGGKEGLGWSES